MNNINQLAQEISQLNDQELEKLAEALFQKNQAAAMNLMRTTCFVAMENNVA